jgi:hypothetical protein
VSNRSFVERGDSLASLQSKVLQTTQQLDEANKCIQQDQASITALEEKVASLEAALGYETAQHGTCQELLAESETRAAEQEQMLAMCRTEAEHLREEISEKSELHAATLQQHHERADRERAQSTQRIASLQSQLLAADETQRGLQQQLGAAQAQIAALSSDLTQGRGDDERQRAELDKLRASYSELSLSLQQSNDENAALVARTRRDAAQLDALRQELDGARALWEQRLRDRDRRLELVERYKETAAALEKQCAQLRSDVLGLTGALEDLRGERERLVSALQTETARVASTASSLAEYQSKLVHKDEELAERTREITALNMRLLEAEQAARAAQTQTRRLKLANAEKAVMVEEMDNLTSERSIERLVARAERDASVDADDSIAASFQLETLSAQATQAKRELAVAQSMSLELRDQVRDLTAQNASLRKQTEQLSQALSLSESRVVELQTALAAREIEVAQARRAVEQSTHRMQASVLEQQQRADDARHLLLTQRAEGTVAVERANQLAAELADLHGAHSELLERLSRQEALLLTEVEKSGAMAGEMGMLRAQLQAVREENARLTEENRRGAVRTGPTLLGAAGLRMPTTSALAAAWSASFPAEATNATRSVTYTSTTSSSVSADNLSSHTSTNGAPASGSTHSSPRSAAQSSPLTQHLESRAATSLPSGSPSRTSSSSTTATLSHMSIFSSPHLPSTQVFSAQHGGAGDGAGGAAGTDQAGSQ